MNELNMQLKQKYLKKAEIESQLNEIQKEIDDFSGKDLPDVNSLTVEMDQTLIRIKELEYRRGYAHGFSIARTYCPESYSEIKDRIAKWRYDLDITTGAPGSPMENNIDRGRK